MGKINNHKKATQPAISQTYGVTTERKAECMS